MAGGARAGHHAAGAKARAPLVKKLGILPGMSVAVMNGPVSLEMLLGGLPGGATLRHGLRAGRRPDIVIVFLADRSGLEKDLHRLLDSLPPEGACWFAWPKRSSKVATDLSDGVVRSAVLPTGRVDTKVCAIEETWTAPKFVLRRDLRTGDT